MPQKIQLTTGIVFLHDEQYIELVDYGPNSTIRLKNAQIVSANNLLPPMQTNKVNNVRFKCKDIIATWTIEP